MKTGKKFNPQDPAGRKIPDYIKGVFVDGRYHRFHNKNVFAALATIIGGTNFDFNDQPEISFEKEK